MRYRRLGRTELMVSDVGLDADALRGVGRDDALAVLRGAIAGGVTLVTWSVADGLDDLEPLVADAARAERGRLILVARLDHLPATETMGPQAQAIAVRLGSPVDILAFADAPTDAEAPALARLRADGLIRGAGYAGNRPLQPAQTGAVDVVVTREPARPPADLGAIFLAPARHTVADCTALPLRTAADLARALGGLATR